MPEFFVEHCGHATANWPWALYVDRELVCSPNGLAFQTKRLATAAGEAIKADELPVFHLKDGRTDKLICGWEFDEFDGTEEAAIARAWKIIDRYDGLIPGVAARHETKKPAPVDVVPTRQRTLFAGLDCLPGQQDLFQTDGKETHETLGAIPPAEADRADRPA